MASPGGGCRSQGKKAGLVFQYGFVCPQGLVRAFRQIENFQHIFSNADGTPQYGAVRLVAAKKFTGGEVLAIVAV
jgi:hypothetical protein